MNNIGKDDTTNYQIEYIQSQVRELGLTWKTVIKKCFNTEKFAESSSDDTVKNALAAYKEARYELLSFIYGKNDAAFGTADNPSELASMFNIEMLEENGLSYLESFKDTNKLTFNESSSDGDQSNNGFGLGMTPIIDIYYLDQLFNVYGEPSYGWHDTNNSDENADEKAQWYTNLFNRMSDGYKVLEKGLASSNEWIQFAFESGLVTMEQVDKSNNWQSIIYTNCSDITEETNQVAVSIAEAEYNRAMNNIENKDKKFDMELKNIDTEHNSLQQEYDSVKSVIDKNIERSFKIYS